MARRADRLWIDCPREDKRISRFVRKVVREAGAKGVVVGLSGGVDSSVVGALCVKSLGKGRVTGVFLPSEHTPASDSADAREMAKGWGIRTLTVRIPSIVNTMVSAVGIAGSKIANANAQARIRMAVLYYVANAWSLLVAGTGDRSELAIGYFTKFGDGGVDFLPVGHLYKTQVRQLARYLGLPDAVVTKPSSPQLWPSHRADDEIPLAYEKLDRVLHFMCDEKMDEEGTAERCGVSVEAVREVSRRRRDSAHKRALPPILPDR